MRAVKALASLRIGADSPEHSLFDNAIGIEMSCAESCTCSCRFLLVSKAVSRRIAISISKKYSAYTFFIYQQCSVLLSTLCTYISNFISGNNEYLKIERQIKLQCLIKSEINEAEK